MIRGFQTKVLVSSNELWKLSEQANALGSRKENERFRPKDEIWEVVYSFYTAFNKMQFENGLSLFHAVLVI